MISPSAAAADAVPGRQSDATPSHDARVEGVEHWAHKGPVRLFLWEKFVDSPQDKPLLFSETGADAL